MATNAAANQARQQHRQVANTIRRQVNHDDSGISAAGGSAFGELPQGAFITQFFVEVVEAFDGTPTFTVGTDEDANNMVIAGDVDPTVTGVYDLTRPLGRSFTAADVAVMAAKLAATNPTQGQAEIVVVYEANMG